MIGETYETDSVVITVDVDWAPNEVLADTLSILDEYEVPATVFSTHDDGCTLHDRHERALHPNFLDGEDPEVLSEISDLYPTANGIRSHSLYTYTGLRDLYVEHGITYESNYLHFGQPGIRPFVMYPDIVQFPIFFMDDMWLRRGRVDVQVNDMLKGPGLKVFAFHPVHVFLNTPTIEFYERNKPHYDDPAALRAARHDGMGVRDLFSEVLEVLAPVADDVETLQALEATLRE